MTAANNGNRLVTLLLAAALGGGGTSAILPKAFPSWYRPDPARGDELRALARQVDRLEAEMKVFLTEGPRQVTENQYIMLQKIDTLLLEIRALRNGHAHTDRDRIKR